MCGIAPVRCVARGNGSPVLAGLDDRVRVSLGGTSRIGVAVSGRGLDCRHRRDLTAGEADIIS